MNSFNFVVIDLASVVIRPHIQFNITLFFHTDRDKSKLDHKPRPTTPSDRRKSKHDDRARTEEENIQTHTKSSKENNPQKRRHSHAPPKWQCRQSQQTTKCNHVPCRRSHRSRKKKASKRTQRPAKETTHKKEGTHMPHQNGNADKANRRFYLN